MVRFSEAMKKMVGMRTGRIAKTWFYDAKVPLLSSPTVADVNGDGKPEIVFGTSKGDLIVLDNQAQELWRYNIHEQLDAIDEMFLDQDIINSIQSPPAIGDINGDGKLAVLFGSEMGVVYCLDGDGKLIWKYNTKGGIRGSPLLADVNNDGRLEVIFGSTDTFLYMLDHTGKLIERFEQPAPVESTPGYDNGLIVFGTNDGTITAITPAGEPKWTHKTGDKVTAAPLFVTFKQGEPVYVVVGSADNNLYCLDVDGELAWTYETQGAIYSQAAVADLDGDGKQELVVGSCDNNVYAITHSGEKYWSYETDFWVVGTPIIADIDGNGKPEVIVGSYDHNIYILDSQGSYLLDYVPGLSGVVQQAGHYSEIMTQEPGQHVGKKLWQFKTEGVVLGCAVIGETLGVVVTTKKGLVDGLHHGS